ncbi:hypothetical protein CFP56_003172 [Quercus suber]|uniref:Uncharacterized protein n=1 Tax=Quercus suber TaxID=58331 RepID=A0AAW0LDC8_QUESU
MESHQDEKTTTSDDRQLKRTIKHQFSRRVKSGHSNFVAPVIKRRKLTSCANAKKNCIVEDLSEDLGLSVALNPPDAGKNVSSQVGSQEKVPSIICAAKSSPEEESGGGILSGNFTGMKTSYLKNETHQSLPSFDLNLPRVYKIVMEVKDRQRVNEDVSCFPSKKIEPVPDTLKTSIDMGTAEQQPDMNTRRQGTRNRPPTIRVLEALAHGYLNTPRKQRVEKFRHEKIHSLIIPARPEADTKNLRLRVKATYVVANDSM